MYADLISDLREEAEWAKCNEWETPIMLSDHLIQAINAIEAQDRRILTLQHEMMAEAESHIAEVNRLNKQIKELQANVRPVVHGHWVYEEPNGANSFKGAYWCNQCHQPVFYRRNFCPNCGADMRELQKEE